MQGSVDSAGVRISAIVPTYNSGGLIDRCLAALHAAEAVDDVTVLDGGSDDGTEKRAAAWPDVRVLRLEGTIVGRRLNEGVAQACHELVLLLNDDAFVDPETPLRLAEIMLERPRVGAAGASLRYEDGREQRSAGRYKTLTDVTLGVLSLQRLAARLRPASVRPEPGTPVEHATWLPLCAAVVRRSAFQAVGGFDERFAFYSDDQDFARRFTQAGWEMVVRTDAGAVHIGGGSTSSKQPGPWFARYYESRFLYLQKHYPRGWRVFAVVWAVRASLHIALWRARALRHRFRSNPDGERIAREWVTVFRRARCPPRAIQPRRGHPYCL
jgi:N-acetylglucosaminyl-diphospho-decaprenol L-rhamnosyltransferase